MIWWTLLAIWAIVGIVFFIMILREGNKYEAKFSPIQLIVAVFWPIWIGWYTYIMIYDKFTKNAPLA